MSISISTLSTGINSNGLEDIARIYPNPSKGIFYLEVNHQITTGLNIQVIDLGGKVIYSKNKITKDIEKIDLSGYPKGIYFIKFRSDKYSKTEKLIIE